MTKRWIVAVVLVGAVALSMSGCKKWRNRGSSSSTGTLSDTIPADSGALVDDSSLAGRDGFMGTNAVAGQFEAVLFEFDSAQVSDMERAKIEAVAAFLKGNATAGIVLEGHCDERGSTEYNMSLGERRALAVRAYLLNLGVDNARLQTKSMGEEMPKDPGHTEESWRMNRRVEFAVLQQ